MCLFAGEPDGWGNKAVIMFLPAIGAALFIGLTFLRKIPHQFNYPISITEENAERSYTLSIRLISWMKLEISLLFSYLTWEMTQSALGQSAGLSSWFLSAVIVVVFGTLIYYLVRLIRK